MQTALLKTYRHWDRISRSGPLLRDLSEQQTADLMGCPPSTVNTQTARGPARLRTALTALQPAGGEER
ncbi:hypothetical protein ACI79G_17155 [Geodermatophilus sp. SYSU D00779]